MKTLYIIRHGKSSWEVDFVEDIDRALTERGVRDAYTMGKRLLDRELIPELIYSSPANRAMHTAIIMARVMEIPEEKLFMKRGLYMAYKGDIKNIIDNAPEDISSLAIFGHNPSFGSLANKFLKEPLENLPTSGVVVISFDIDSWKDISPESIISEHVDCPKKKW
jgi:phosphohistidine phosphatase